MTKPITVNADDGAVTIAVSALAWRWLADSVRVAICQRPELNTSDMFNHYDRLAGDLLEREDNGDVDVAAAAALVVSGLAVLGGSTIGSFLHAGMAFTGESCATDALLELGALGIGPVYGVSEGKKQIDHVPASALADLLVEVVS